jgi:hypothetical protein
MKKFKQAVWNYLVAWGEYRYKTVKYRGYMMF